MTGAGGELRTARVAWRIGAWVALRTAPATGEDGRVWRNELGQPVGSPVPGWTPRPRPSAPVLAGSYCRLERLTSRHAPALFAADQLDTAGESWTYLPYGPFPTLAEYQRWVDGAAGGGDPMFYAVVNTDRHEAPGPVGVLSLMRMQPEVGVIEVGHVHYSPLLQRRRAATEAQFLLARYVFDDLGYRRFEWKCDALNAPSRAAAHRLGFRYEGTFRQATVVKGRNRDTAWYSIIGSEWPAARKSFTAWLDPANFDSRRQQRASLRAVDGDR